MLAVDWGTSSLRVHRVAADGRVVETRSAARGILAVTDGDFAGTLEALAGDWLDQDAGPVLLSGMIGSRQGWLEAPYVPCPAGLDEIRAALAPLAWSQSGRSRQAAICPGLSWRSATGVPDVMRGEEAQLLGALDQIDPGQPVCLPGTHSKWATIADGRITRFATHLTGEAYAVLRQHSILGRLMTDAPVDPAWFRAGVSRAREPGGLLHHLFGVRPRGLLGDIPPDGLAGYLSGILIGHEVAAALADAPAGPPVALIGAPDLAALYETALAEHGRAARRLPADLAARGLWRLAGGHA